MMEHKAEGQRPAVIFRDLGRTRYQAAWDEQTRLHEQLKATKRANRDRPEGTPPTPQQHYLLFCEHPHVYTLGKSGSKDHLLLSEQQLSERDIDFYPINRGGDITYHGPGQIVGYPILDLEFFFTDIHRYVRIIEEAIIRTIAEYGIEGGRIEGYSGVWLHGSPHRKICAVGIHLSRWVTMHGFAFNVNTDLSMFGNIVPCGIQDEDKTVTSLAAELGRAEMDMQEVKAKVLSHLGDLLGFDLV
jgi:lipoyl(octanoyl) transferase